MKMNLPNDIETKLAEYRRQRRSETGKVVHRSTAIVELLRKALDGVEPPKPLEERLSEIDKRLDALERGKVIEFKTEGGVQ
ncbi:hypothetical protein [Rosistilla oblonga]|uniref:hypothetical protein n=1 Tax=Rosistilla oblonga TaxID=2527990 RepID=UPI003A97F923